VEISAKTGLNIEGVLEALVQRLPPPKGDADAPLKALLVDSWYDPYLGVVILVRVKDGRLRKGQRIRMMANGQPHLVEQVGVFSPKMVPVESLGPGEMGYLNAAIKTVADTNVGDTLTDDRNPATEALPGFKPSIPVVWCGLYPVDADDFEKLRESVGKLRLNDSSFHYEMENSAALGLGYRCGFLGLLHLEIVQERLSREFDLDLIATAPSVVYKIRKTNGEEMELHNPADMPDPSVIEEIEEPWIKATIMVPEEYLGSVLTLCNERRGEQAELTYVGNRAMAVYRLPLNEVVFDFYDRLKSVRRGYASLRLRDGRLRGGRPRQDLHPREQRAGGRAVLHGAPAARPSARPRDLRAAEGADPAPALQDPDPGGDRRAGDRARDHLGAVQGRDRQVLRRRHHAASASSWRSRRRARSACGSSARSRSRRAPSSPPSRWTLDRRTGGQASPPRPYSTTIFAFRTTVAHCSRSRFWCAASSSGVDGSGTVACWRKAARSCSLRAASRNAWFSRLTTGSGVRAGA
jgi:hypothetical protein